MSCRAFLATVLMTLGATLTPARSADQQSLNNQLLQDATLSSAFGAKKVELDLANGADVNSKDKRGKTALMVASYSILDSVEVVRVLLEHGADVNAKDSSGQTALIFAAYGIHHVPKIVSLLLEHGANVNAKDKDGKTALEYARVFFHEDIADLILEHRVARPGQQLVEDARLGSLKAVRLDLAHGADVNAKDKNGKTALMQSSGNTKISRLLVEHRANVNARDNNGETALMMAAQNKNIDVVDLLLTHGADVSTKDKHDHTALEYAFLSGGGRLAELILRHFPRSPGAATSSNLRVGFETHAALAMRRESSMTEAA